MKNVSFVTLFLVTASPAMAADMVEPTTDYYDWTGWYAGINAGAALNNSNVDSSVNSGELPGDIAHELKGSIQGDETAFTGGVQAGYNWQSSNFVLGVEADFNYLDIDQSRSRGKDVGDIGRIDSELGFQADWFGTLRGRLGYAFENVLVYGTGGLAYGHEEVNGGIEAAGNTWRASESDVNWGWVLGGGAQFAIDDNWSVGAEYLYVDLGSSDFNFDSNALNDINERINGKVDAAFSVVRATMSFRF